MSQFANVIDHSPRLDWGLMLCGALNKTLHLLLRSFWLSWAVKLTHSKILGRNRSPEGIPCELGPAIRDVGASRWVSGLHSSLGRTPELGSCDGETAWGCTATTPFRAQPRVQPPLYVWFLQCTSQGTWAFLPSAILAPSHSRQHQGQDAFTASGEGALPVSTFQVTIPTPSTPPTTIHHSSALRVLVSRLSKITVKIFSRDKHPPPHPHSSAPSP